MYNYLFKISFAYYTFLLVFSDLTKWHTKIIRYSVNDVIYLHELICIDLFRFSLYVIWIMDW